MPEQMIGERVARVEERTERCLEGINELKSDFKGIRIALWTTTGSFLLVTAGLIVNLITR